MSNAITFTRAGGRVRIDVGRRDGVPDDVGWLRVAETGPVIPRTRQGDGFDAFPLLDRASR